MAKPMIVATWWKRWGKYVLLIILGGFILIRLINDFLAASSKPSHRLTVLHKASASGWTSVVRGLLLLGYDVNSKESFKNTIPLHWAACKGHHSVVSLLLNKRAEVNAQDRYDATPLHYAAGAGRTAIVAMLLEYGGAINSPGFNGETPLFCAADDGYSSVELLWNSMRHGPPLEKLSKLSKLSRNPLDIQIETTEKYNTVDLLLSRGADPYSTDDSDNTILHAAARGGSPEIVKLLLSKGLDVNARNARRDALSEVTPLHYAALYCHSAVMEILLAHGAEPDVQDQMGNTPLQFVKKFCDAGEEQDTMIKLLRQYGVRE